jgi:hypothetical protein
LNSGPARTIQVFRFPEVGASPPGGEVDTASGRGRSLAQCRQMQQEMGWNPDLSFNCFVSAAVAAPLQPPGS